MRRVLVILLAAFGALALAGLTVWAIVTQPVWVARARSTPRPPIDLGKLEARVRRIVGFPSRSFGRPEQMALVARYIRGELEASGAEVTEQPFVVSGETYRNVCAAFGPPTPDRVVVGAHYDAADELPGADDNASGVAGLLALADRLGQVPLKRRVELVAFALEEPPVFATDGMGSYVHARSLREAGVGVVGMISLEMIGCFSDQPRSQEFPIELLRYFYPSRGNFIAVVSRLGDIRLVRAIKKGMRRGTDLPVLSLNGPALVPGVALSDHSAFWDNGFPAAMVTDTAFYRNPRYHAPDDTPDTLDYRRMGEVVQGVYTAVLALAES